MKTFATLALTMVLTAAMLVGCGCTNQNKDNTSAPTVLPTNEEIWNSTETTTRATTEATTGMETTNGTTMTESTDASKGINETEVQNHVNAQQDLNEKIRENQKTAKNIEGNIENSARRMMPGSR
jgi:hypothetical protein